MKVLAYDALLTDPQKESIQGVGDIYRPAGPLQAFRLISIHTPLTRDTEKMFHRRFFSGMKKTAFIINTSRGGVINEPD